MELRRVAIRRVANRHSLFMGGDRELVMFSAVMAFSLIFSAQELRATIFGIVMWVVLLAIFRRLAKSDPQMRQVYLNHRKYKAYYPAHSTPFRENTKRKDY